MGAHSTLRITPLAARVRLAKELVTCDERTLERLMDVVLDRELYNCQIVSEHAKENEDNKI